MAMPVGGFKKKYTVKKINSKNVDVENILNFQVNYVTNALSRWDAKCT